MRRKGKRQGKRRKGKEEGQKDGRLTETWNTDEVFRRTVDRFREDEAVAL